MNKDDIKKDFCSAIDIHLQDETTHIYVDIGATNWEYRYIPSPEYIPYTFNDNVIGWFKVKGTFNHKFRIIGQDKEYICYIDKDDNIESWRYADFLEQCEHLDGTPAGKLK